MKKQLIRKYISDNQPQKAIDALREVADQIGNEDYRKEIILQSSKFNNYKRSERLGSRSPEELDRVSNALNNNLLELVSYLKEDTAGNISLYTNYHRSDQKIAQDDLTKGSSWWKWVVGFATVVGILAGIAEISGVNISDWNDSEDNFPSAKVTLTVYLHGSSGPNDIILENQGKLYFYQRGERREASIRDGGVAIFNDVSPSLDSIVRLFLDAEGYRINQENTEVNLLAENRISVQVESIQDTREITSPKESPTTGPSSSQNTERPPVSQPPTNPKPGPTNPPAGGGQEEEKPETVVKAPAMITVRCLTYGADRVDIWFYDPNTGEKYEATALAGASDVAFRIPASLKDQVIKVNFKRQSDGYQDFEDFLLTPSRTFEIPRSVRNE